MNKANEIRNILDEHKQYREALFCRGYLITTQTIQDLKMYPFYGLWKKTKCGHLKDGKDVHIYYHQLQDYSSIEQEGVTISIIGHAYNPFDMKFQESTILKDCFDAYQKSKEAFFDKISELTGIHLIAINDNNRLILVQDATGMRSCFYGMINNNIYIASHPQLVGDLCNLAVDKFVNKLTNAFFFRITEHYLPGDLSPYIELKRLGPNTYLSYDNGFNKIRFYPIKEHPEINLNQYNEIIDNIKTLIQKNLELCSKKWDGAAISLSGGIDSNTTLACANGLYEKFKYYSFHCKPSEVIDSNAARQICNILNLKHLIYAIPNNNEDIEDFEILKKIICHNTSNIQVPPDHEIRKFIFLYRLRDIKVELKSWMSEIGRAMFHRKFGVDLPQQITPRFLSILQSRFFAAPKLFKETEQAYNLFMETTDIDKPLLNYEHSDLLYWEIAEGSNGSAVVTSQDFFHSKLTIPMNNRKLLDMFLWFPHQYKKNDLIHAKIIQQANKRIADAKITTHNLSSGTKRLLLERTYYYYRTILKNNWI